MLAHGSQAQALYTYVSQAQALYLAAQGRRPLNMQSIHMVRKPKRCTWPPKADYHCKVGANRLTISGTQTTNAFAAASEPNKNPDPLCREALMSVSKRSNSRLYSLCREGGPSSAHCLHLHMAQARSKIIVRHGSSHLSPKCAGVRVRERFLVPMPPLSLRRADFTQIFTSVYCGVFVT